VRCWLSSISAFARGTIGALALVAERQPERLLATSAVRAEQAGRSGRRRGRVCTNSGHVLAVDLVIASRLKQKSGIGGRNGDN